MNRTIEDVKRDWIAPQRRQAYYRGSTAVELIREAAGLLGLGDNLPMRSPEFQTVRSLLESETGVKAF